MIFAVEMYIIIIITLVTITQGSLQTCFHYCKLSPEHSTIPRPECDCNLYNARKIRSLASNLLTATPQIKDSGIYYEPAKNNSSHHTSFDDPKFYMFSIPSNQNSQQNTPNGTKYKEHHKTSESFAEKDTINQNNNFPLKYKRNDNYFQKIGSKTNDIPLHLYLDLDLHTSEHSNRSHIEELKHMFKNFQASEKHLSECINLHIYIFSKYVEIINKTNTNWGRKVEHDNLSSSQELTEIQKKCDQPTGIIKQSIYQIKQSFPKKEHTFKIEQNKQMDEKNESISSNTEKVTKDESRYLENTTTLYDSYTTLTTYPADDINNAKMEMSTVKIHVQYDKKNTNENALNSFKNDNLPNSAFTSTSPILNVEGLLNTPIYNKTEEFTATHTIKLSGNENLKSSIKTNRTVYDEENIQIPRIITREFPNGTVMSVIDGHEDIPNSDFNTKSIISAESDESTSSYTGHGSNESVPPDSLQADIGNNVKSDFVEMQGHLYFLFGKQQIPARFIQQPDGELNVAIDGFSLCAQMLEENTSKFMNLLWHMYGLNIVTLLESGQLKSLKNMPLQHKMLCSKRFDDSSFTSSARIRLNNPAIPVGAQDLLIKYSQEQYATTSGTTQDTNRSVEKPQVPVTMGT